MEYHLAPNLWLVFKELVVTPFHHSPLVWGIVPLYFGLLLSEMTPVKASFRTGIQTGFSFIWAGAHWLYPYFHSGRPNLPGLDWPAAIPVNLFVTFAVIALGIVALVSGLRRKFPRYFSFLGYARFSNYFMILIFPIQAQYLAWTWPRLAAVALFAVPVWLVLHFGLMPLRPSK